MQRHTSSDELDEPAVPGPLSLVYVIPVVIINTFNFLYFHLLVFGKYFILLVEAFIFHKILCLFICLPFMAK